MAKRPSTERNLPIPFDTRYFNVRYFNRHGEEFLFSTLEVEKYTGELLVSVKLHEDEDIGNMRFVDTILLELKTKQDYRAFETMSFHVNADEDFIDALHLNSSVEGSLPIITFKFVVRDSKFGDIVWVDEKTTCEDDSNDR